MSLPERYGVLIADEAGCPLGPMALRLTRIGIDPVYTNDADEALLLARQEGRGLGAVAFPTGISIERIDHLVKQVAVRVGLRGDALVPVGVRPDDARVIEMRERGIRWALWEPFSDPDLRFVLARVIEQGSSLDLRLEPRVPAGMVSARLYKGSMGRPAELVDLSVGGAFLATEKPLPEGAAVTLEVELPTGLLRLRACVCWTRRDLIGERSDLFMGMGVEFTDNDADQTARLRRFVRDRVARYVVSVGQPAA